MKIDLQSAIGALEACGYECEEIATIERQRDELLAALEKANGKLRAATMCHPNAAGTLVEEAYQVTDAAIDSVKGQQ